MPPPPTPSSYEHLSYRSSVKPIKVLEKKQEPDFFRFPTPDKCILRESQNHTQTDCQIETQKKTQKGRGFL